MDTTLWLIAGALALAAFLSGSIPFGLIVGKAKGIDVRTVGSKNIGATNVGRLLGRKFGVLVFVLDAIKGFVPAVIAGLVLEVFGLTAPQADRSWVWLAIAMCAVLGHMFSPWVGFKGGKGVATAFGALVGVMPMLSVAALIALVVWIACVKLWRFVSVGSIAAAAILPVAVLLTPTLLTTAGLAPSQNSWRLVPFVIVAALLGVMVIYKHRPNIARLLAGTEPKVGAGQSKLATHGGNSGTMTNG